MPVYNTHQLLQTLTNDIKPMLEKINELQLLDDKQLNTQPATGKWSVAQIIEHLNSYNRYYLPAIEKALQKTSLFNPSFKSGWFGNYFTKMMMPGKDGKVLNKMNAPQDHIPIEILDSKKVLDEFIAGQRQLVYYIEKAKMVDIGKLSVPISISKYIKLKLGDTFRFLIAHQQRHFIQLNNALSTII